MRWRPILIAGLAAAALALAATRQSLLSPPTVVVEAVPAGLSTEILRRCRDLGQAALADDQCREAWRQSRRLFLSPALQPTRGAP